MLSDMYVIKAIVHQHCHGAEVHSSEARSTACLSAHNAGYHSWKSHRRYRSLRLDSDTCAIISKHLSYNRTCHFESVFFTHLCLYLGSEICLDPDGYGSCCNSFHAKYWSSFLRLESTMNTQSSGNDVMLFLRWPESAPSRAAT